MDWITSIVCSWILVDLMMGVTDQCIKLWDENMAHKIVSNQ